MLPAQVGDVVARENGPAVFGFTDASGGLHRRALPRAPRPAPHQTKLIPIGTDRHRAHPPSSGPKEMGRSPGGIPWPESGQTSCGAEISEPFGPPLRREVLLRDVARGRNPAGARSRSDPGFTPANRDPRAG